MKSTTQLKLFAVLDVLRIPKSGRRRLPPLKPATRRMRFSGVNCLPGGRVQFTVSGVAGDVYRVLASTNLYDWQTNASITNLSGTMQFTDPDATGYNRRFYRLVMP